jgi:hypothetical protein
MKVEEGTAATLAATACFGDGACLDRTLVSESTEQAVQKILRLALLVASESFV